MARLLLQELAQVFLGMGCIIPSRRKYIEGDGFFRENRADMVHLGKHVLRHTYQPVWRQHANAEGCGLGLLLGDEMGFDESFTTMSTRLEQSLQGEFGETTAQCIAPDLEDFC